MRVSSANYNRDARSADEVAEIICDSDMLCEIQYQLAQQLKEFVEDKLEDPSDFDEEDLRELTEITNSFVKAAKAYREVWDNR